MNINKPHPHIMHAYQKFMISSLLEGIFEFFFLYLYISNQFLPDEWHLAEKKT